MSKQEKEFPYEIWYKDEEEGIDQCLCKFGDIDEAKSVYEFYEKDLERENQDAFRLYKKVRMDGTDKWKTV